MMKKGITILLSLLLSLQINSQSDGKQQLINLFNEAEHCYLMDDYQQLEACIKQYSDTFLSCEEDLGDSIDVYRAYYAKMCGAYYYGFAEEDSCDYYSEKMYETSLEIFNRRNNTPNALTLHEELAQLYYKIKAYHKAKEQLDSVLDYYDNLYTEEERDSCYYKPLSQMAMCNARLGLFDLALRQIDEAIDRYYKKFKDANYYEALRRRGKILMLQADSLGSTRYKKAVDAYQKYVNERYSSIVKEMSGMNDSRREQYWLATHQFLYDCFRLGNHAPEMLYDLALFSKDYLVRRNAALIKWGQVKKSLGKKDCAIEFVQYFGKKDERRLGCLILKNNSKRPLFIDIVSTDSLLDMPLTILHTVGSAINSTSPDDKDVLYQDPRLTQIIWNEQLMKTIGDATHIYFAPDGLLHQLAIEYLIPDSTKICYRLSSTRILTKPRSAPKIESVLLCGGIEYDANYKPYNKDNDVVAYRFLVPHTTSISYLPGTKKEVDSIYYLRHNAKDMLLKGNAATDEAFLRFLKRKYDVVHISTHGYYGGRIGIYNDIKPLLNDESMSKSGLLFAGAANTLTDKSFDENMFDGVLSATELSKQDFSTTELIVLSACQTGLGHMTDDGVYGLQRGLKLAGAQAMMLSLWSVDDASSSLLMRYFYEELNKQSLKDIHAAFLTARRRLMKEEKTIYKFDEASFEYKEETIKYDKPHYVNPFIIIDAY